MSTEHGSTPFVAEHVLRAPNVNALWAGLLVEELVRQGVGLFVVCPGSRSTPLAVAVARMAATGCAEWLVHPDERAAAFVALGWARATGLPAAVITTSGSAVAHLFPAVVEADAVGVPLLLLTADRPPELRETGANQTIRQPGLFGGYVRWSFDVPPPTADVDPAFVLTTAAHAVHRSLSPAGPVHLNLAFREPLGLEPDGTDAAALVAPLQRWTEGQQPYTGTTALVDAGVDFPIDELDREVRRGLVVLGPCSDHLGLAFGAGALAEALGWPLLQDVTAKAQRGSDSSAVGLYDAVLASESFAASHKPEAVLLIGGRPLSKRLSALIDDARPWPYIVVRPGPERFDPSHRVTHRVVSPFSGQDMWTLAQRLRADSPSTTAPPEWASNWKRASHAASEAIEREIARGLTEPFVARTVAARVPAGGALVLAASMPVRDVDTFTPFVGPVVRVVANRGASGIDGTVATAHGVARALGAPVVALVGDLALIHDQTSLMLLRDGPPVVVVVVNNDGGGIFHFLPVARGAHPLDAATFEAAMAAPHGLTFEHAAAQMGLAYHAPATADAFEAALDEALASGRSAVIEVRTDRAENAALHTRILDAVREAVDAAMDGDA